MAKKTEEPEAPEVEEKPEEPETPVDAIFKSPPQPSPTDKRGKVEKKVDGIGEEITQIKNALRHLAGEVFGIGTGEKPPEEKPEEIPGEADTGAGSGFDLDKWLWGS